MVIVLFEVEMKPARGESYFELAAALGRELEQVDGFLSVERFESLSHRGRYLSVSRWRDREAVRRWRENAAHAAAQRRGTSEIFARYRIQVAEVFRDYGREPEATG